MYNSTTIFAYFCVTCISAFIICFVSNETFIKHVYKNVYGTNASLADVTALTTWMTTNNYSQADVLVTASELSAFETTIGLVGLATTGIEYTPFVA